MLVREAYDQVENVSDSFCRTSIFNRSFVAVRAFYVFVKTLRSLTFFTRHFTACTITYHDGVKIGREIMDELSEMSMLLT
jgi:hypothetical protein